MLHDQENGAGQSLAIFLPDNATNLSEYTEFTFSAIEDLADIKSLSEIVRNILLAISICSFVVGTYFKCIFYLHIYRHRHDEGNKFKERPINVMILCGALVHHATHFFIFVNFICRLSLDVCLGDYMGNVYCYIVLFVGVFGTCYLIVGSMCIAILRVIYIKRGTWILYGGNKKLIAYIIFLGGLLVSITLTILFIIERSSKRVLINSCMGYSTRLRDIIYQYEG